MTAPLGYIEVLVEGGDAILAASALRSRAQQVRTIAAPHEGDTPALDRVRADLLYGAEVYDRVADLLDPHGSTSP